MDCAWNSGVKKAEAEGCLVPPPQPRIRTLEVQLQRQDILEEDALLLGQLPSLLPWSLLPNSQLEHVVVHHSGLH